MAINNFKNMVYGSLLFLISNVYRIFIFIFNLFKYFLNMFIFVYIFTYLRFVLLSSPFKISVANNGERHIRCQDNYFFQYCPIYTTLTHYLMFFFFLCMYIIYFLSKHDSKHNSNIFTKSSQMEYL